MKAGTAVTALLVRHGEQTRDGDDGSLTERGREQARQTAEAVRLTSSDSLVSSSLRRAIQTAQALGAEPLRIPGLDEFRFGPTWTWAQSEDREDQSLWLPQHHAGRESLAEFEGRVCAAFERLLEQPLSDGRLVVVLHSGVLDVLLRWALGATGQPWIAEAAVAHASITELGIRFFSAPNRPPRLTELRRLGDTSHLPVGIRTGL